MRAYIVRRLLYFIPVWLGVFLLTFAIFHLRAPLTLAAVQLPQAPLDRLQAWVRNNVYHLPRCFNLPGDANIERADGRVHPELARQSLFHSQFFLSAGALLRFDLGTDRTNKPIADSLGERIGPTLSIMLPAFLLTALFSLALALLSAYLKDTALDRVLVFAAIALLSVALPAYIIGAQYVSEGWLLIAHVLRNSAVPVLTQLSLSIPFLITGSVLLEQYFGIPGMGDLLYAGLVAQDFQVIKALVYLGAFVYMLSALATDILYAALDPRIRLEAGAG